MDLVPSTFLALALIGILIGLGLTRGLWVFFAMMPFGAAAAFNLPAVGGASFGIKELAVIALFCLVFAQPRGLDSLLGSLRPGQPGATALILFVVCVISALWIPRIFEAATEVFTISRSANANGIRSIPLGPSAGNITQLFALTISCMAFLALATHARLSPDPGQVEKAMVTATLLNLGLGLLDVGSAALGVSQILDPIRTANYSILDEARMMGVKRMIGGFTEASTFGNFSLALFAYWLHRWLGEPTSTRAKVLMALALFMVLRSTSSAAYVALVAFIAVYASYGAATRMKSVLPKQIVTITILGLLLVWHAMVLLFAAYELSEPVTAFFDALLFDKLGSDSGVERMSWNAQALKNVFDTYGIGAGLGSVRASNWLLSSLGSIGLPGTLLFIAFLLRVFRMRAAGGDTPVSRTVGALKWACAALLMNELLIAATPNLGVFFFALAGLITGLARSSQTAAPQRRPTLAVPA